MPSPAMQDPANLVERLKTHTAERALDFLEEHQILNELLAHPKESAELLFELLEKEALDRSSVYKFLREIYQKLPAEQRPAIAAVTLRRALNRCADGQLSTARQLAFQLLADEFDDVEHDGLVLFRLAQDEHEPMPVRQLALSALGRCKLSKTTAESLLDFIAAPAAPSDLVCAALKVIERQHEKLDRTHLKAQLSHIVFTDKPHVRRQAISVFGAVGDLDAIEQVCALPTPLAEDIDAVQSLVRRVLSRPRNLLCVSPTTFEYVIRLLLERMGFRKIHVTRPWRDDGIDLVAYAEVKVADTPGAEVRYIVQCKRYRSAIGPAHIKDFLEVLKAQKATDGYFITTSSFTKEALEAANGWRVKPIAGQQLLELLDFHVDPRAYVIAP